jgi:hypothetical protein
MKNRIILIALGLAAAFILLLIYHLDIAFHSLSTSSDLRVSEIQSSRPAGAPGSASSPITGAPSSQPGGLEQKGALGTSLSTCPVSPVEVSNLFLKLTESSYPKTSRLFRDCFRLMDQGNYREARLKLGAFMEGKSLKSNEYLPPAWWMLAWCILNEGGKENLLDAADRFLTYSQLWPAPGEPSSVSTEAIARDYEELAKAAIFNRAVIYTELLSTAHGEEWYEYTGNAKEALNSFLARWPGDPQALEVHNMLDRLLSSH